MVNRRRRLLHILLVLAAAAGSAGAAQAVDIQTGTAAPQADTLPAMSLSPAEVPLVLTIRPATANLQAGTPVVVEVACAASPGVFVDGPAYPQPLGDWAVMSVQAGTFAPRAGK